MDSTRFHSLFHDDHFAFCITDRYFKHATKISNWSQAMSESKNNTIYKEETHFFSLVDEAAYRA